MLNWFLKKINNRKGFTLIELIVVVAILGILALIAVPRLSGMTATARENADKSTLASINNAIQVYCVEEEVDTFVGATGDSVTIADTTIVANVIKVLVAEDLISPTTAMQTTTYQAYTYKSATNTVSP